MAITVHTTAAKTQRSLVSGSSAKSKLPTDAILLFWRRLVDSAVADAKLVGDDGLPTNAAILARWWLEDNRPSRSDADAWETSFECACHFLQDDATAERVRLLAEIDLELATAHAKWVEKRVSFRRSLVLACAGMDIVNENGQFVMPLASKKEYDHTAGICHGDPAIAARQIARIDAATTRVC